MTDISRKRATGPAAAVPARHRLQLGLVHPAARRACQRPAAPRLGRPGLRDVRRSRCGPWPGRVRRRGGPGGPRALRRPGTCSASPGAGSSPSGWPPATPSSSSPCPRRLHPRLRPDPEGRRDARPRRASSRSSGRRLRRAPGAPTGHRPGTRRARRRAPPPWPTRSGCPATATPPSRWPPPTCARAARRSPRPRSCSAATRTEVTGVESLPGPGRRHPQDRLRDPPGRGSPRQPGVARGVQRLGPLLPPHHRPIIE